VRAVTAPGVQPWRIALRDAAVVVLACAVAGSLRNVVCGGGIPFIQHEKHEILVPCPETSGDAPAVAPSAPLQTDPRVLVIDARDASAFAAWHAPRAQSVPFDYLAPAEPATIRRIASSGAREVIVYGDGGDPDPGEQLAKELSGKGIRNVTYVAGGAPAIQAAGRGGAR
jgi:rhodanese-related sulfurtransferase